MVNYYYHNAVIKVVDWVSANNVVNASSEEGKRQQQQRPALYFNLPCHFFSSRSLSQFPLINHSHIFIYCWACWCCRLLSINSTFCCMIVSFLLLFISRVRAFMYTRNWETSKTWSSVRFSSFSRLVIVVDVCACVFNYIRALFSCNYL